LILFESKEKLKYPQKSNVDIWYDANTKEVYWLSEYEYEYSGKQVL
jgi:hypothetical protein